MSISSLKTVNSTPCFAGRVREKMNEYGCRVTVAVAPKSSNRQRGILVEGVDYALLGQNADAVFLMTYEWGYTYGPPMAVAPLDKVREVVEYAVTQIQPGQLILGIPNYGYDWTLPYERGITRARSIGNAEAVETASENGASIEYARISQSPWFTYRKNGMEHIVWFEDVRSITAKWELIREFGLVRSKVLEPNASVSRQLAAGRMNFQKKCIQLFLTFTQKAGLRDQLFVSYKIISDSQSIRKEPADGNRPPDSRHPENRESGQCVSKGYTGSERHDC